MNLRLCLITIYYHEFAYKQQCSALTRICLIVPDCMACQPLDSMGRLEVTLKKNSRGIGIRICGGIDVDSNDMIDKLIRVKFLFPGEPAMESGLIDIGDIIIEANGQSMIGITRIVSTLVFIFIFIHLKVLILLIKGSYNFFVTFLKGILEYSSLLARDCNSKDP